MPSSLPAHMPAEAATQKPCRNASRREVVGVDVFAGAGGFSLGALNAGVKIAAAVEIQKSACATYKRNLIDNGRSDAVLFQEDILTLDPHDVMARAGIRPGQCDILLGGPPCQGFSSHRLNNSGVDDPRNQLLLRYFEYVNVIRPRFFLVENVPGLLWPRHRKFLEAFYRLAEENGYDLPSPFTLNARDYGVPQNRRRVFLFGTDRSAQVECIWPPSPTHADPANCADLIGLATQHQWKAAATVFSEPLREDDENNLHMKHNAELTAAFEKTPINGGSRAQSGRTLKCHEGHNGHSDVYGRIDPSIPGPTMTTACINPSKGRFVHPTEPHGITLRHAARFQTFPEWFVFEGGLMAGGAQIGNAVPVEMATALIAPMVEALKTRYLVEVEAA